MVPIIWKIFCESLLERMDLILFCAIQIIIIDGKKFPIVDKS